MNLEIDFNYDYSVFDNVFIESDVIINWSQIVIPWEKANQTIKPSFERILSKKS
jgi:hypothetical protein